MQNDIAVVGMLCHVPGASDVESFWELLVSATEGLRPLRDHEITEHSQNVVMAGGFIDGIDLFDAERFSLSASEVTLMDPQHRLWLQACHALLEVTGMAAEKQASVGVFASAGPPSYLQLLAQSNAMSNQSVLLGNVPDCLATRVAYHLGLTGPTMTIQCGCSSSLVSVHQARMALLARQCDAALVGGVHVILPAYHGYTYVDGGFASPDGHCRPFSDDAQGTVLASGYGVVMLKRLADAKASGDTIFAVIKGSAVNNDGADKASFTAPSVQGQANVIAKALRVAGLAGTALQYIESHGTATPLGDPIELAALEQGLGVCDASNACWIGSVKANIGHLDVAAGIMGFIKTSLMLHHKTIPAQIHFNAWNPKFTGHRFQIATRTIPWDGAVPRRAGVSAFGFGGTNAHVILEEAESSTQSNACHPTLSKLFILSAPSSERLWRWLQVIRHDLKKQTDEAFPSLLYSLQVGRKQYAHRLLLVVHSITELVDVLERVSIQDFVVGHQTGEFQVANKSLHEIQKAWLSGLTLDWRAGYEGLHVQKVILPPSPAFYQSYWISDVAPCVPPQESNQKTAIATPETSIYRSFWQEVIIAPEKATLSLQPLLLISPPHNQSMQQLSAYLEAHQITYYWITTGDEFKQMSPCQWQMNVKHADDFQHLMAQWNDQAVSPKHCVFVFEDQPLSETATTSLQVFFDLINKPSLLSQLKILSVVTYGMNGLHQVDPNVASAVCIGLCRSIGQEYAHLQIQLLDLEPNAVTAHPQQILQSLCMEGLTDLSVWRQGRCWQQEFKRWTIPAQSTSSYFKPQGVYIITGGLGDVASVYVEFLAKSVDARLILVGRTPIPATTTWDTLLQDPQCPAALRKKIARLMQWKSQGYSIEVCSADVTNAQQMAQVFEHAFRTYARIDGFIHVAGAGSDLHYKLLKELTWQHCWQLFSPKLSGIEVLAELALRYQLEQCVVVSSISSCLTGIGLGAYGASHNVLDAFIQSRYPHWLIMNWDAWNFYQHEQVQEKEYGSLGGQIEQFAISFEQGLAILRYAFQQDVSWQQIYISLADLNQRYYHWVRRGFTAQIKQTNNRHPRPKLMTEYSAPVTAMQNQLVVLWQQLLGVEPVGINDNFFELGGHSLLALSLIQQLQSDLQLSCAVVDLFSAPTVAELALKFQPPVERATHSIASRITKQLNARQARQSKGLYHVIE